MYILELTNGIPTEESPLIGIFEYDQAKALHGIGCKIIFVGIDLRSIRRKRKLGLVKDKSDGFETYCYSFPIGGVGPRILNCAGWFFFKKVLKRVFAENGKPDIIHAHFGRGAGVIAYRAKKKFGMDYIVTEHDSLVKQDIVSKYERKQLKNVYHNSIANIAVSAPFKDILERIYSEDFEYIPNIADLSAIKLDRRVAHDGFKFVSVGNLLKGKGFDVLLKAFSELVRECENVRLTIIGDGIEKASLIELAKSLKIENEVEFLGRLNRTEISAEFGTSDCFALASRCETFGVVYIEAMAAGLPVIATKCGGPEGFVNEDNGVLVDVDDIADTAKAMRYMMKHASEYDPEKQRKYVEDNFSPKIVAEKIKEIYDRKHL